MSRPAWIRGLLLTGTLGALVYWNWEPADSGRAREGSPAPSLHLRDVAGQSIALPRGKVVLLDFWTTWCASCTEELPQLRELYRKFRGRNFELLAASLDEDGKRALIPFIAQQNVPWPVALADSGAAAAYGVYGLPTKILIDERGIVSRRYVGPIDAGVLERDIENLLSRRKA